MTEDLYSRNEMTVFKRKFNNQLEPYKVMLISKKHNMLANEWKNLVEKMRKSVLLNPDQYLEIEQVPQILISTLVNRIFEEYLNEEMRKF